MKLTKVLVGLLAISLCGMAGAAGKRKAAPARATIKKRGGKENLDNSSLRAIVRKALKSGADLEGAKEAIDILKGRGAWRTHYRDYLMMDLGLAKNATVRQTIEGYIGAVPSRKIEEKKEEKKTEITGKKGEWPTDLWDREPDWEKEPEVAAWQSKMSLETEPSKKMIPALKYAIGKMEASKIKSDVLSYIDAAKEMLADSEKA
ncbi:MAG: hypothetical protein M1549_03975 [Candidatus Dependentiae bacterium]|nr:hypothetical protein [Candidatus Dependentiae bacterium]